MSLRTIPSACCQRFLPGRGQPVLLQAALRPVGNGPFEERQAFTHHGKGVHVFLPVVHYLAGDSRTPESSQLEKTLRVLGQEPSPIKHLGCMRKNTVNPQAQPIERLTG